MKRMSPRKFVAIVSIVLTLSLNPALVPAKSAPRKGGAMPEISLPIPKAPAHRKYLGLSGKGQFKIPQIKADVVIIEIFSMY
jgi:hypothetical protein